MSTASRQSRGFNRRINSLQNEGRHSRNSSLSRRRPLTAAIASSHALRVAYLTYLLQPRSRRVQNVSPAPARPKRSSTSIHDLMSDFSLVRDSKSTRIPHGFVSELEKRLTGVLMGREKKKEYQDHLVVRTFAVFLNVLKEESFRKRMEKDRRAEDLLLIFYSNAVKELSKGKEQDDDSWKLMVDRHVALFVRLLALILKSNDWARDRPELANRLAVLENKLLLQDQDLMDSSPATTTTETLTPLSYDVKDMPLVQHVIKVFGMTTAQAQAEIDKNKSVWTEKAALQDLKTYQTQLSLHTRKTLCREDFETDEAFETWKKSEGPDLSQMMLAIVQSNPELAKSTPGALPHFNPAVSDELSSPRDRTSYSIDQSLDFSALSLGGQDGDGEESDTYTFIPSDPRAVYRFILNQTLSHDLRDREIEASQATADTPSIKLLSKQSMEMLNEICLRWRIPPFSRVVLFLDVVQSKYVDSEIDLNTLDSAFTFAKETPNTEPRAKRSSYVASAIFDRQKWTVHDLQAMQQLLSKLHEALLRELYDVMMDCFEAKPRPIGPVMYILEHHIQMDPSYTEDPQDINRFSSYVQDGLAAKTTEKYQSLISQMIPVEQEKWQFDNIIQLSDAISKLAQKIQKRYRNNPEIMGVNPYLILCVNILPMFAEDANEMVLRIMDHCKAEDREIDIEDGFDLYRNLAAIRRLYTNTISETPFPFHVESLLEEFVWRWLRLTDQSVMEWVNQAIRQDNFTVRGDELAEIVAEDKRHSVSVIDIFRSYNQVVENLVGLGWDDDLQYAKFMTALSKSIGKGVAKYCESLEQMFAREMDKLTPEQEAALNQTTQEKLMQFAKDTWTNKDKIEPFQFSSESLVKLNNIEFALTQLDRLEREINVDACADVIARNTPAQLKKVRKSTTYVFTIKVVEAEDLKACDMNGGSDPYVVLTDEYQKRIAKTRIIYNNLNPRWEDAVDITTQGPLNIIATIWDWDAVGDHDYVGRTSIKLDPVHFSDFLPREYWLDLDTQGRLLLRVSMEGERDDIQFYFGKAFRTLKRTERDMTRRITEKLSAYISHCLSRRTLKSLLSRGIGGISMSTVSNFLNRNRGVPATSTGPTAADVENALDPLFSYFNDNFAIMNKTLTEEAMRMVMARLWKEVLATIESLLVPPLSDKPSHQKPLTVQEVDIVSRWLVLLLNFFHAVDEETGEAGGVPLDILKSPKYHEIQSLNFFYFEPTENLIRTSERMASANVNRQHANRNRLSAPAHLGATGPGHGSLGIPATRRAKSIMLSRNLGTMKKVKEEKRREAQADPNDDMILRILRMRPEAAGYLRDRSRQKERLAAAAAADAIVKQSLMAGVGSRMSSTIPRR
ncbi:Munc13-1 domain-containing protein [Penicillium ucsense]|uniref:Munc13-1 domain-containing protein n=1 Tax=Penicillium ucsense TaxID=2839758 RepID=A0A8J8VZD5_9EURO|nr:Munc13-1 domain-containing protein [Penicillium ucsense]KAF7732393.1 Munc13-1 domain-containing protein [Penicillium ucsense]